MTNHFIKVREKANQLYNIIILNRMRRPFYIRPESARASYGSATVFLIRSEPLPIAAAVLATVCAVHVNRPEISAYYMYII